jgi:hypothetical protein
MPILPGAERLEMARDENVPMEPAVVQGGLYFATEYHSFQARSNISEPGFAIVQRLDK